MPIKSVLLVLSLILAEPRSDTIPPAVENEKTYLPKRAGPSRAPKDAPACRFEERIRFARGIRYRIPVIGEPTRLRSRPMLLDSYDYRTAQEKGRFFNMRENAWGCFVNVFSPNPDSTITDSATNLQWQSGSTPDSITFDSARRYVESLNRGRFAGFSDWRLPTAEEWASLVETAQDERGWHLDPGLFRPIPSAWIADSLVSNGLLYRWTCSAVQADCDISVDSDPPDDKNGRRHHARAVRSLAFSQGQKRSKRP